MSNHNSSISSTRRKIRSLASKAKKSKSSIDIDEIVKFSLEIIESLKLNLERNNNQITNPKPKEGRFVRVIDAEGTIPKLTFRPSNGEILLKVGKGSGEPIKNALIHLSNTVAEEIPEDCGFSLRGSPKWSKSVDGYKVTLQSNSGRVQLSFVAPLEKEI